MQGRGLIRLRLASSGDAGVLARIHLQARATAMPWLPVVHTDDETLAWMTDSVLPRQEVWIAARDDITLGFMALTKGWIEQLYVEPSSWRAGAGSALLTRARERQPNGFLLWTFQRNVGAREFYRKQGLAELRETDGHGNDEGEPDVLLGWKLRG